MKTDQSIFRYLTSINSGLYIDVESDYNKFLTLRGLSMFQDIILYVNELNKYPKMDLDIHYEFLKSVIPPRKRFSGKWPKPVTDEITQAISIVYNLPIAQAHQVKTLLTRQQIDDILTIAKEIQLK